MIAVACNPASKVNNEASSRLTTAYVTSTRQLKSDKIPDSVFQMTTLRRLTVTGDDCNNKGKDIVNCWLIRDIPAEIASLQQLLLLELKGNDLRIVPQELGYLLKLKTLDLSDNPALTNINAVTKLINLEYLYLYGCDLQVLPADIGDLGRLKQLGLAGNRIGIAEQERIKQALPNCKITF
jgi:Leucine-rich repeat (LRR) protein